MTHKTKLSKFFRDNFLSGLLVVVPLVVSMYVLVRLSVWIYKKLVFLPINYERIAEALSSVLPPYVVKSIIGSIHILEFIAVIVALFLVTTLVGLITKIRLGNWILRAGEMVLEKIPLIGMVYSALKQLMQAVFSGKGNFNRVVMLEYPRRGIWSLGFVSRDADSSFSKRAGEKLISVFVPTTPNPTSGFLLMLPQKDLIELDINIEQAFKIIISGGMVLAHEEPYEALGPEDGWLGKVMEKRRRDCPPDCDEEEGPQGQK